MMRHVDILSEEPRDILLALDEIYSFVFSVIQRAFALSQFDVSRVIALGYWLLKIFYEVYVSVGSIASGLWENFRAIFRGLLNPSD
jgi:hypothetical protein